MSILDFPSSAVAGDRYRGYRYDGVKWNKIALSDPTVVYPSQSGNSGKFLTTNGVTVSWSTGTPGPQGERGERGETGAQGVSVTLQGTKATIADLPAAPLDPQDYAGHGWIVTEGGGNLWFWNLTDEEWNNVGPIVGPQGDPGPQGDQGEQGPQGDAGDPGTTDYLQLSNRPQYLSEFTNDEGFITETDRLVHEELSLIFRNGEVLFPDSSIQSTAWTGTTLSLSDTAPTDKDFWFNTVDNRLYVNDGEVWVDASPHIAQETFSGDYDDLDNKPTIPSVKADLTPTDVYWDSTDGRAYVKYNDQWVDIAPVVPVEVPTDINQLTDDDGLLNFTGGVTDYNDLDNLPTLFSGDYNDLSNAPTIPNLGNYTSGGIFINGENRGLVVDEGSNKRVGFMKYFGMEASFIHSNTHPFQIGRVNVTDITTATIDNFSVELFIGTDGKVGIGAGFNAGGSPVLPNERLDVNGNVYIRGFVNIPQGSLSAPTLTTRSGGTRMVLWPQVSSTDTDYAIGMDSSTMWFGIPNSGTSFKWYGGTTKILELSGSGSLTFADNTTQTTAWTGSVAYSSVTGTPSLATVATSGSYEDLSNKPTLFSGSYTDLTNKPTIYTSAYIGTTSLDFTRSSASQTLNGVSIDGNAATATSATSAATLTTSRNINGVGFNGSANINVPSITDGTNTLKIVAVPSTLAGALGDVKGNVAFDDNYAYYCKTSYGGSSYSVITSSGASAPYMQIRKGSYPTPQAGWTVTFGSPVVITSVVDAGVVFGYDSWTLNFGSTVSTTGGNTYTLTDTSSTIWVRTPWDSVANTITYTPGSTTGNALTLTGKDTIGGTGYFDFLKATNTTSGVANGNKTFRLNSTGTIEVINSAYSATIFSLTDTGGLSVPGPISISGKKAVNGPAFRAYVSVGQTINSGSQQTVTFGAENFDTDSCFTSNTFTPTVEGYYQFNATVRISGGSSTGECMIVLYKNSSEYARGNNQSGTEQGASFYSMQISDIAYANGSTDSFHIRIQQTSGSNRETTAGSTISYFSGCMIRGA